MLDMEQKESGPLIISANSTVWNIILRCATCCRLRRKWGFPKITNLPKKKKMHGSRSIHLLRSQYVWTNLDQRKTIRPQTLCCSLYMILQSCCTYRTYQYNRWPFVHYGIAQIPGKTRFSSIDMVRQWNKLCWC